jgi:hypothetical protein
MLKVLSILTSATVEINRGIRKPSELTPDRESFFTHLYSEMYFKLQRPGKKKVNNALHELPGLIRDTSTPRESQNQSSDPIRHGGTSALVGEPRTLF